MDEETRTAIKASEAREFFPRGLVQPPGCFRFGMDALLLGAYAARKLHAHAARRGGKRDRTPVVDLGCGCGAAMLALCLADPRSSVLGIEREAVLVEACRQNISLLGVGSRAAVLEMSLSPDMPEFRGGDALMVLANPPWRKPGSGLRPDSGQRERAVFGDCLHLFCAAAAKILRHHGYLCLILTPDNLPELCRIGHRLALGTREILPIAAHPGEDAARILCLCQKNAMAEPAIRAALALHEPGGDRPRWRAEALEFCPWLAGGNTGK